MRAIGLGLLCLLAACGQSQVPVSAPTTRAAALAGPYLVDVRYENRQQISYLSTQFDHIEHGDAAARTLRLLVTEEELQQLRAEGYELFVAEDATRTLQAKSALAAAPRPLSQNRGISGFPCYRTVQETEDALRALQSARPDLVELRDIGDTWAKLNPTPQNLSGPGHDLWVVRITSPENPGPKPVFLLHTGTHAREYATVEVGLRFAETLVQGYGTDPDLTWILDHFEVHVFPQGNPDARLHAERGLYWRKNVNINHCPMGTDPVIGVVGQGVDLNRNMAFMWGPRLSADAVPPGEDGSSSVDCNQAYRGPSPDSEPENQALADYMAQVFRDQRGEALEDAAPPDAEGLFISVHSTAASNLFPWTFDESIEAPNMPELRRLARKLSWYNLYPAPEDYTANANGIHHDYAYALYGVASITIELDGGDFFQDCASFEASTAPQNLDALRYAAKTVRRPYQGPAGPEIFNVDLTPVEGTTRLTLTARASDARFDETSAGLLDPEPIQNIVAARYSIGQPSWLSGATLVPLDSGDGTFDASDESLQAELDTASLSPGRHLVFVEAQDADGNWGLPSAVFLNVSR